MEGRPNGMPSFRGRIPEEQAWQIVAYVRSMSGITDNDSATNRSDTLLGAPPENLRDPKRPGQKR
jgi:cytochrome c oxidase cbb3-type subunit 3